MTCQAQASCPPRAVNYRPFSKQIRRFAGARCPGGRRYSVGKSRSLVNLASVESSPGDRNPAYTAVASH